MAIKNEKYNISIGLGVHKSGTSWIYNILAKHPQINLAQRDRHFFSKDSEYEKGFQYYNDEILKPISSKLNLEMSNDYLFFEKAIKRIKSELPNAKLFVCLRNPVDRAISHFYQDKKTGLLSKESSFEKATTQSTSYIEKGRYKNQIEILISHFDLEQIQFVLYDDIISEPDSVLNQLSDFWGIAPFKIDNEILKAPVNFRRTPRYVALEQFQNSMYYRLKSNKIFRPIWSMLKTLGIGRLVRRFNTNEQPKSEIDRAMIRNHYHEDIKYISVLLNRKDLQW